MWCDEARLLLWHVNRRQLDVFKGPVVCGAVNVGSATGCNLGRGTTSLEFVLH